VTARLECQPGFIHISPKGASTSVEVTCVAAEPRPKLVEFNADQIGQCRKGCVTDCDCGKGHSCVDNICRLMNYLHCSMQYNHNLDGMCGNKKGNLGK